METSDLRRALCGAICGAVMAGEAENKRWLVAELEAMPFERRGDRSLLSMANKVLPVERVAHYVKTKSADRYDVPDLVLCLQCQDTKLVEREPGYFSTCRNCCPLPVESEPAS